MNQAQLRPTPRPTYIGAPATLLITVVSMLCILLLYGMGLDPYSTEPYVRATDVPSTLPFPLRALLSALTFRYPAELAFGALLMYHFSFLERQMGTRKFIPFAVFATVVTQTLQVLYGRLWRGYAYTKCGPYGLLFACITLQSYLTPCVYRAGVGSYKMSQHTFSMIMAAMIIFSDFSFDLLFNHPDENIVFGRSARSVSSVMAAAFGLFAGLLYLSAWLGPLERWAVLPPPQKLLPARWCPGLHAGLESVPEHLRPERLDALAAALQSTI
ncbi:hypothetical protein CDCA_CDCA12G3416 [Cyanidium caldarium]|uniref:Peptidase S54 rhomboid domain-containing protein n=1 Tax=Cyanidium caldarium TaxID=2771 RepID=A0AAV9IZ48_CYACA|nr:hypothetical protein CDCA_CDCA12G3416 [Cyanidium caldarium]